MHFCMYAIVLYFKTKSQSINSLETDDCGSMFNNNNNHIYISLLIEVTQSAFVQTIVISS